MKVGIITFHASHNYGSMLQAYALQQTVLNLGHECEIINFRTKRQRNFYKPFPMQGNKIKLLKAMRYPRLAFDDIRKHLRFENFLKEKYILTPKEYDTSTELKEGGLDFDCYISGSDQIWNTSCFDFDTAYYLDFVTKGRCVAYAPSMGPCPEHEVAEMNYPMIRQNIAKYSAIAVRESKTAQLIKKITGRDAQIALDSTFLLNIDKWDELTGDKPLVSGEYILLYTPWYCEKLYEEAAELARRFNLKVICTIADASHTWARNPYFSFHTAVGPVEFINLIKNARLVVSGSFHAVVFSMLYGIPFYARKGMGDSRIADILNTTGLQRMAEMPGTSIPAYDAVTVHAALQPAIGQSIAYLKKSLN